MKSSFGENIKITLTGASHGEFVRAEALGVPSGFEIDKEALASFMKRRQGGNLPFTTPRKEADEPVFDSGLDAGVTNGQPLTVTIYNKNVRSGDYNGFADTPRPSHVEYTAQMRYGAGIDLRGGGHFSARLTAPLCAVGGIFKHMLEKKGIFIGTHLYSVGSVKDEPFSPMSVSKSDFDAALKNNLPVLSADSESKMVNALSDAFIDGDSLGGVVECAVIGLDAGYGNPLFDGLENRISSAIFGLGGVRGIEFGLGFEASAMRGSAHNDAYEIKDGRVVTKTNNCGGIIGGISNGMPIIFRVSFKPTASISVEQDTVSLSKMENAKITVNGRHDPCIAIRALPCVEALAATVIADLIISRDGAL